MKGKKICVSGRGLVSPDVAKAIEALPKAQEIGFGESKKKAKKKKKLLRELARRQKRLDKIKSSHT